VDSTNLNVSSLPDRLPVPTVVLAFSLGRLFARRLVGRFVGRRLIGRRLDCVRALAVADPGLLVARCLVAAGLDFFLYLLPYASPLV